MSNVESERKIKMNALEIKGKVNTALCYAKVVEDEAIEQIRRMCDYAMTEGSQIRIMPDVHAGKGCTIGTTMTITDKAVPNVVGVDIGCGMYTVNLGKDEIDFEKVDEAAHFIPSGREVWEGRQEKFDLTELRCYRELKDAKRLARSLGTLGGGNHFIEIQKDTATSDVWVMIHSGSRNIGLKVANHYNKIAQYWNEKWYSEMVSGLAYLPMETQMAKDYFREMNYCVAFAFANRQLMMTRICEAIQAVKPETDFDPMINIAHNYAAWENHFDQDVIVHRKGATRAYEGEIGIIPGSMGTKSYIVEGLGNPESFKSCSHGAGRLMGRKDACRRLSLDEEKERMDQQGIIHGLRSQNELDEAPGAYKDIAQVIANERDLVKPLVELAPMAVIKG